MATRAYWIETMQKIVNPVLQNAAAQTLRSNLIIESESTDRANFSQLEIISRTLVGIAPWLESEESAECLRYGEIARAAIAGLCDEHSPDYGNFGAAYGDQPIVDAAFLAQAMLRAPKALWARLDDKTKANVISSLRMSRACRVYYNNWLLFAAIVEAFFCMVGVPYDAMRIDYALKTHNAWYKGDGIYGDGPDFHFDYYNSFVIHPMLVDILAVVADLREDWGGMRRDVLKRAQRYARVQEMCIAPDGTYPAIGRSIAYRFGAFGVLSQAALLGHLPDEVSPAQARCALTAVIRRVMAAKDTFTPEGWLTIGLCGHQPRLGEIYISTPSLYLCTKVFLPLGLPAAAEFWSGESCLYSAQKIWSSVDMEKDHAMY